MNKLGWGTDKFGGESSSVLLKVSLSMLSTETCMKNINIGSKITNNMLCAYTPGKDTCSVIFIHWSFSLRH